MPSDIINKPKIRVQVTPEIWTTLSVDAKKWLLNERKRQQQEDDQLKSHQVARILPKFLNRIETIPPIYQVNKETQKYCERRGRTSRWSRAGF
jgi:hypothetical protein